MLFMDFWVRFHTHTCLAASVLTAILGVDCGAHLCEEISNPTVNVPKVIVSQF